MNHCYGHNFPVETCLKEYYLITIIIPNPNMELKRMDIHVHHNQSIWHSGALRKLLGLASINGKTSDLSSLGHNKNFDVSYA